MTWESPRMINYLLNKRVSTEYLKYIKPLNFANIAHGYSSPSKISDRITSSYGNVLLQTKFMINLTLH